MLKNHKKEYKKLGDGKAEYSHKNNTEETLLDWMYTRQRLRKGGYQKKALRSGDAYAQTPALNTDLKLVINEMSTKRVKVEFFLLYRYKTCLSKCRDVYDK